MNIDIQLARAIAATPDPPCLHCRFYAKCMARGFACNAWETYVTDGTIDPDDVGRNIRRIHLTEQELIT